MSPYNLLLYLVTNNIEINDVQGQQGKAFLNSTIKNNTTNYK